MTVILNNRYFLLQEYIILGLLSDTRKQKRKLGKTITMRARAQKPEIVGVRKFTKIEKIEDANPWASDYSDFLDIKNKVIKNWYSLFF